MAAQAVSYNQYHVHPSVANVTQRAGPIKPCPPASWVALWSYKLHEELTTLGCGSWECKTVLGKVSMNGAQYKLTCQQQNYLSLADYCKYPQKNKPN